MVGLALILVLIGKEIFKIAIAKGVRESATESDRYYSEEMQYKIIITQINLLTYL